MREPDLWEEVSRWLREDEQEPTPDEVPFELPEETAATISGLVGEYLDTQSQIEALKAHGDRIKDQIDVALGDATQIQTPAGVVARVKGRKSEKVDVHTVKKVLITHGVDIDIIDAAITAATTSSVGRPSLRVTRG